MNLFLGVYKPRREACSIFELDGDSELHNRCVYVPSVVAGVEASMVDRMVTLAVAAELQAKLKPMVELLNARREEKKRAEKDRALRGQLLCL